MNAVDQHSLRATEKPRPGGVQAMRLVLAGGATGGHLFPAIAMAEEFQARHPDNRVLFVSTGNAFERSVLSDAGFELAEVAAEGIKGRGLWRGLRALWQLPRGIWQAVRILRDFGPDMVIGVGSYASGAVVIAAWLVGIKIALHEQNLLPGIANRMLAPLANRVYVSFEESRGRFKPEKVLATGNPVRRGLQGSGADAGGIQNGNLFTVLILGGSQGAHGINMAMADALEMLSHTEDLAVVHQTGRQDEERLRQAYQQYGIAATVGVFFGDMPTLYRQASLVICRAGATTVAELVAMGKASILIPFPFAADDHQALNARHLVRTGAAELIREKDLTGRLLAERIEHYRMHPEELAAMAARASSLGKPEAARMIVDDCYALAANLIH